MGIRAAPVTKVGRNGHMTTDLAGGFVLLQTLGLATSWNLYLMAISP